MAHIIAISNHKGGVGKTTSTINIGAALAQMGKSVLLIDLDPQASLTISLGVEPGEQQQNIYTTLVGKDKIQPIKIAERLGLVPSNVELMGAEREMASTPNKEYTLGWRLSDIQQQYQYILIDCPPSLGLLTTNALTAADRVYIPLQAQYLAMQGMANLQQAVELVRQTTNSRLQMGVFLTQYDSRKVLHRNIKQMAEQTLGAAVVCKTAIRDNIALAEAPIMGQTIYQYAPKSKGAADYMELAKEINKRCSRK